MTNQVNSNLPEGITIDTFRSGKKGVSEVMALVRYHGKALPIQIIGASSEESRSKAENSLALLNTVHDFSVFEHMTDDEINTRIVSAFTGSEFVKPDKRNEFKNTAWVSRVVDGKVERKRVKIATVGEYIKEGYIASRDPSVAERKRAKLEAGDGRRTSTLKGQKYIYKGSEHMRVDVMDVHKYVADGWIAGRSPKATVPDAVLPAEADPVEPGQVENTAVD